MAFTQQTLRNAREGYLPQKKRDSLTYCEDSQIILSYEKSSGEKSGNADEGNIDVDGGEQCGDKLSNILLPTTQKVGNPCGPASLRCAENGGDRAGIGLDLTRIGHREATKNRLSWLSYEGVARRPSTNETRTTYHHVSGTTG